MKAPSKLFFITILFIILSFFLIYQGVQEELIKRQQGISEMTEDSGSVLQISDQQKIGEVQSETTQSAQFEAETYFVTKVVDGDTIEIEDEGQLKRIRLIGVDTPETVDPNRPKGCYGAEASNKTKELLTNKRVILEKDVSETDKYQRLLRYVYLPLDNGQKLFVNDYLVREGFAQVLTYPPDVKFNEQFLEAQRFAKENKKGLWGICN